MIFAIDFSLFVPGYLMLDLYRDLAIERNLGEGATAIVQKGKVLSRNLLDRCKFPWVAIKTYKRKSDYISICQR